MLQDTIGDARLFAPIARSSVAVADVPRCRPRGALYQRSTNEKVQRSFTCSVLAPEPVASLGVVHREGQVDAEDVRLVVELAAEDRARAGIDEGLAGGGHRIVERAVGDVAEERALELRHHRAALRRVEGVRHLRVQRRRRSSCARRASSRASRRRRAARSARRGARGSRRGRGGSCRRRSASDRATESPIERSAGASCETPPKARNMNASFPSAASGRRSSPLRPRRARRRRSPRCRRARCATPPTR